ncbi:hypothetical protein D6D25_05824 [Aureobasidium pullulans]|nr:hypothetical protein D6D25_05824 [Aureobasidium pullulans]
MDTKHWTSSASTMEPLSPFISLPNEIVTQICEHPDLNKDDLIALRLTCKAHGVHDAATKALGRYFRDITVLFTRHSFQTLVDVCEHPVFGRSSTSRSDCGLTAKNLTIVCDTTPKALHVSSEDL